MIGLWVVRIVRLLIAVAYACALLVLAYSVWHGEDPTDVPTATHALAADQKIAAGDLQTGALAGLLGHYMRADVKAGDKVTKEMVADQPTLSPLPTSIAVIVRVPRWTWERHRLANGSSVSIVNGSRPLGVAGKIIRSVCDDQICSILVGLDKAPVLDPNALVGADVVALPGSTPPAVSP